MERLGDIAGFKERQNIILQGFDPVLAGGFTQLPNLILRDKTISVGAKVVYAALLSYAWHKDCCFPGQEALAEDLGVSKRSVITFLQDLEQAGYLEKVRRGLGKTNTYILHCQVKRKK